MGTVGHLQESLVHVGFQAPNPEGPNSSAYSHPTGFWNGDKLEQGWDYNELKHFDINKNVVLEATFYTDHCSILASFSLISSPKVCTESDCANLHN